jgi:hypothetical protein
MVSFIVWETIFPFPLLDPIVWSDKNFTLILLSASFGYMSFITNEFWIALYMQDIQHFAPLHIAVLLLPQALVGVIWSYLGQSLISKISGTLIMAIGGFAYLAGAILLIFIKRHTSYWMFLFPALCITVIGADFQFIVSNVCFQIPTEVSILIRYSCMSPNRCLSNPPLQVEFSNLEGVCPSSLALQSPSQCMGRWQKCQKEHLILHCHTIVSICVQFSSRS